MIESNWCPSPPISHNYTEDNWIWCRPFVCIARAFPFISHVTAAAVLYECILCQTIFETDAYTTTKAMHSLKVSFIVSQASGFYQSHSECIFHFAFHSHQYIYAKIWNRSAPPCSTAALDQKLYHPLLRHFYSEIIGWYSYHHGLQVDLNGSQLITLIEFHFTPHAASVKCITAPMGLSEPVLVRTLQLKIENKLCASLAVLVWWAHRALHNQSNCVGAFKPHHSQANTVSTLAHLEVSSHFHSLSAEHPQYEPVLELVPTKKKYPNATLSPKSPK